MYSGDKRLLEVALAGRSAMVIQCRRNNSLVRFSSVFNLDNSSGEYDLQEKWERWTCEESRRRLGFCVWVSICPALHKMNAKLPDARLPTPSIFQHKSFNGAQRTPARAAVPRSYLGSTQRPIMEGAPFTPAKEGIHSDFTYSFRASQIKQWLSIYSRQFCTSDSRLCRICNDLGGPTASEQPPTSRNIWA